MSVAVVVLLAAAGLAAWFWELSRSPKPARPDMPATASLVVAGLAAAFGLYHLTAAPLAAVAPLVAVVGGVLSSMTAGCPDKARPSLVAFGALPPVVAILADQTSATWLWTGAALTGVAAFGFWATWTKSHRHDAALLPLATIGSALLLVFLHIQVADFGLPATGAVVLVATLGLSLAVQFGDKAAWVKPALAAGCGAASALAFQVGFHRSELAVVAAVGGLTALVIGWLWGEGAPTPTAGALGGLAWTGVATVGFSQAQTPGMAAAALVGLGVTAVMGRPNAAAAMSPIFALAAYRLLFNLSPETLRAFDIGQHYVTVGLLIGAATIVALNEFVANLKHNDGARGTAAQAAAWVAALGLAAFAAVFLGERGSVGVILGLALGGSLSCLSGRDALAGAVFGGSMSWLVAAWAPMLAEAVDIKKDQKMAVFGAAVLVVAALAATAGVLARPMKEEPRAEA